MNRVSKILLKIVLNLLIMVHTIPTTAKGHHIPAKSRPVQTRSQLLNEQNKYKHVLYTLLSNNYVDAAEHDNNIINDYNLLHENDNDKYIVRMEHYNFIVDYLRQQIQEINDEILNLDEDNWDTKDDNIIELYRQQRREAKKANRNQNHVKNGDQMSQRKHISQKENNEPKQAKNDKQIEQKKQVRFKRSPLEMRTLKFHKNIFNFDRNLSVELDETQRKFATGVYLRGNRPEGETKGSLIEELRKWRKEHGKESEYEYEEEEEKNATTIRVAASSGKRRQRSVTGLSTLNPNTNDPTIQTPSNTNEQAKTTKVDHQEDKNRTTLQDPAEPTAERQCRKRLVTNLKELLSTPRPTDETRPTIPDFIYNFADKTETLTTYDYDQFKNLINITDGRDPDKYTVRLGNPHPSAEYFMDKIDGWVSWAHKEVSRLSATPTTKPLSTLDYSYSKASVSRFFSLNPRYLQSTDEDGLNKWGGRQFLPRSRENTGDIRDLPMVKNTDASAEYRSFYTWRDCVDWSRQPSNRPSTHPYFSVEVSDLYVKIFKCVSCNKWESKNLASYIDHLYEHFLRNSLMIPSFEEILTELRRREALTGTETWRREFKR